MSGNNGSRQSTNKNQRLRINVRTREQFTIAFCCLFAFIVLNAVPLHLHGQVQNQNNDDGEFQRGEDTQEITSPLLTDAEALAAWGAPEGFDIQLFASAPSIAQPISATFDQEGRLWLAENYTYSERPNIFQRDKNDRILVLEDSDNDGHADSVKVFWDEAKLLSSVEVGMGGVWALCTPNLIFIPDADGDAVADGPPQIILDGFEDNEIGHNMVNGLRWGPDGWLYGRHGIQATSYVGRPGTEKEQRQALNCCIWRYHPVAQKFEVVCQGTTNSWGHDWTDDGELFFINTVIGHLWHAIPNSHFDRMYGEDLTPYTLELIPQVADHFHWDKTKESWNDVQQATSPATMEAGGGHAHSGMLICQGPMWPETMQGSLLTVNYHGRRLNRDQIVRSGATYTATHQPDFCKTEDVWFRGIDLIHGPDNSMYLLDWSDLGECHENDGVHRSSGRIYKFTKSANDASLNEKSKAADYPQDNPTLDLIDACVSDSPWEQRRTRVRLQSLAFGRSTDRSINLESVRTDLRKRLFDIGDGNSISQAGAKDNTSVTALRLLWALQSMGGISKNDLFQLVQWDDPSVRRWAVKLLSDGIYYRWEDGEPQQANTSVGLRTQTLESDVASVLLKLAQSEDDSLVITYLASSMRNLSLDDRWKMGLALSKHQQFADDRVLPLLIWYGLEPAVVSHADQLQQWLATCRMPRLNRLIAWRLAAQHTLTSTQQGTSSLDVVIKLLKTQDDSDQKAMLEGMAEGLSGWNQLLTPDGWVDFRDAKLSENSNADNTEVRTIVDQINLAFGDHLPLADLITLAKDGNQSLMVRSNALVAMGRWAAKQSDSNQPSSNADSELATIFETLNSYLYDRFLGAAAAEGLFIGGRSDWTIHLLNQYPSTHVETRPQILRFVAQRIDSAKQLLQAIEKGTIAKQDVTPYLLRQLQLIGDKSIVASVEKLWPELELLKQDQLQRIQALKNQLTPTVLAQADLDSGHRLFNDQCGKCHKLFGEGSTVGPDLTGGQRSNITYWLQNILAPSAEVGTGFRMSIIQMIDGRVLVGVITERTDIAFKLTTQTDKQTVLVSDVEEIRQSAMSLMPDGLLDTLTAEERRDLIGYLMSDGATLPDHEH